MVKELLMASLPVVTILNSREHHYLTSICSSTSVDIISIIRISIVSGDLQGTVLAPVLFVLYIPIVQWRSQNFNRLCYTEFCCSDCSIRVTALLGYLDLAFWNLEHVRSSLEMPELLLMNWVVLASLISSALYIQQVQKTHAGGDDKLN